MRTLACWSTLFAVVVLSAWSWPALGQETTGRLEGRVLDTKGEPIADVNVAVLSPALQGGRGCLTNTRGTFMLPALPVGEYVVTLAHLAYQKQVIEQVRVRLGQTTSLGDVRLSDAVLEQPEIVVSGRKPLIDLTSTAVGGVVATREVEPLPIARDYRSVAVLLPQANVSYLGDPMNYAGATGLENRFFIDGVDVTDPWRFKDATALPYNFVEEVEVRTGGYEAQYRSALGGTVNAITYSGGNQVTGRVFGFYTQNRIVGDRPRYAWRPDSENFALYDVGFGLGGPIRKDRLWYYVAYNPTFTTEDVPVQGWGMFEDKTVAHSFAGKLTWRADDRNTVVLNAFGDPTHRRSVSNPWADLGYGDDYTLASPDPALQRVKQGGGNLAAEGRHALRKDLLLESGLSYGTHQGKYGPDADEGQAAMPFVDKISKVVSGGAGYPTEQENRVITARLAGTWWKGSHEFKAGAEYKDVLDNLGVGGGASLTLESDSTWLYSASGTDGHGGTRMPSLFVQDGWRLTPRIRLNLGLRWENVYMISTEGTVAQTIANQWQPRLGLTWDVNGTGTQKVSASYGRFYHDVPTWPLWLMFNKAFYDSTIYYRHDPRIDPRILPGDSVAISANTGYIQPEIDGLQGHHFDEFTLGYERGFGSFGRFGVRGTYRTLRRALQSAGIDTVTGFHMWGNPGWGPMTAAPRARRDYSALEITWQGRPSKRLNGMASYVLSRNHGNYPGMANTDWGWDFPTLNGTFENPWTAINAEGPLPNDRTHVFKLSGSCALGRGLTMGAIGLWESGTPLSKFGQYPNLNGWVGWPEGDLLLTPRGSEGRTPSLWDFNLRIGYEPPRLERSGMRPKLTMDLLHIASRERPVTFDQLVYILDYDYDQGTWTQIMNPNYGKATQWQQEMAVRFGAEVQF